MPSARSAFAGRVLGAALTGIAFGGKLRLMKLLGRGTNRLRVRPSWMATTVASLVLVGIAATLGWAQIGDDAPRAVQLTPGGVEKASRDTVLSNAQWVFLPQGRSDILAAPEMPALHFPPGTTYAAALTQLYISVSSTGALPASVATTGSLPRPVVVACRADGSLDLSLLAPFGYDTRRAIRPPSFSLPASLEPREVQARLEEARKAGRALPEGASVDVPPLGPAQVIVESGASCVEG